MGITRFAKESTLDSYDLVTGGAGFIGAHVVNELISQGRRVVVLDDLSGGFEDNVNPQAKFVKGSVLDHGLIERLFEEHKIEHVFHLAAYAAEGLSHFIRRFNYENNVIGSVNLINAAVRFGVKCFVFTSSIAVYGTGECPLREEHVPRPEDPYGIAKYSVELDLRAAHEMFGLDYIIFRPHNVYGEFQNLGDRYRNVIGIFMNQLMQGDPLTIFGDGSQTRAFSYVGDVAPYIARSLQVPEARNTVFNLGADKQYSVTELAEEVIKVMGASTPINYLPPRNEVHHAYSDHSRAHRILGCPEGGETTLSQGLARMAEWAKRVGARKTEPFANIEITDKLPPSWRAVSLSS